MPSLRILGERTGRMEDEIRRHFDEIIEDASTALEDVEIETCARTEHSQKRFKEGKTR